MPVSRFSRPCLFTRDFSPPVGAIRVPGEIITPFSCRQIYLRPYQKLEMYVIAPFINNFCNRLDASIAGPNGERSASYGGIGDITAVAKYLLLEETDAGLRSRQWEGSAFPPATPTTSIRRAWPGCHWHRGFHLHHRVNLYKWLKPFLIYSNIWLNTPVNLYPSKDDAVRSREFVTFNLAAEYPINKKWLS